MIRTGNVRLEGEPADTWPPPRPTFISFFSTGGIRTHNPSYDTRKISLEGSNLASKSSHDWRFHQFGNSGKIS